jgi:hypothetical protein
MFDALDGMERGAPGAENCGGRPSIFSALNTV